MLRSAYIVYSSSTGHTEFVVDTLIDWLQKNSRDLRVVKQRAEKTTEADLLAGDILILACGSWNTGNSEGQLSPFMFDLLINRVKTIDLGGKPATAIGLGDERYFFTCKAVDHLTDFLKNHNANLFLPPLKIINDPYDQEEKVTRWSEALLAQIDKLPLPTHQ